MIDHRSPGASDSSSLIAMLAHAFLAVLAITERRDATSSSETGIIALSRNEIHRLFNTPARSNARHHPPTRMFAVATTTLIPSLTQPPPAPRPDPATVTGHEGRPAY